MFSLWPLLRPYFHKRWKHSADLSSASKNRKATGLPCCCSLLLSAAPSACRCACRRPAPKLGSPLTICAAELGLIERPDAASWISRRSARERLSRKEAWADREGGRGRDTRPALESLAGTSSSSVGRTRRWRQRAVGEGQPPGTPTEHQSALPAAAAAPSRDPLSLRPEVARSQLLRIMVVGAC